MEGDYWGILWLSRHQNVSNRDIALYQFQNHSKHCFAIQCIPLFEALHINTQIEQNANYVNGSVNVFLEVNIIFILIYCIRMEACFELWDINSQ